MHFLERYLALAPQYPTVALWRCWEAALFSGLALGEPLLDLGCGDGTILESLLNNREPDHRPSRVYGLDINADSVRQAIVRPSYAGAVVADARRMPLARGAFASIVSVCVLEHIEQIERVLREVARILRPGGTFAFSVPTPLLTEVAAETHPREPAQYVRAFNDRVEHRSVRDLGSWRTALAAAGLPVRKWTAFMPVQAARAWFGAYDWVVRPIRGRGVLYRAAGPGLRRFGLSRILGRYWFHRLRHWAEAGVSADLDEACALFIVAEKP